MVYITGDIHGKPRRIVEFSSRFDLKHDDVVIILGDAGINYYLDSRDDYVKRELNRAGCIIFCVHGNHEARPQTLKSYKQKLFCGGRVLVDAEYPNILFAVDGDIFTFDNKQCIVLGGAYSVDKSYRLSRGYTWWSDEQMSPESMDSAISNLKTHNVDVVLSHTCPEKYIPFEMFLPDIDQATIDRSTERWLDTIDDQYKFSAWYCGHWHIDKRIDNMHFLMGTFEVLN